MIFAVGVLKFLDLEFAFHGDWLGGEFRRFALAHLNDDAVIEGGAWTKAAFHVVPYEYKLFDARLLVDAGRQDIAADANRLLVESLNFFGEHFSLELAILFDVKFDVIECKAAFALGCISA